MDWDWDTDTDEGRTGAPDDSEFSAPAFAGPVINGEQFAPGYTPEAAAYEQATRERSATATQLERRGYAVWTSPAASLAADARAREASRLESGAGYPEGFGFDLAPFVRRSS